MTRPSSRSLRGEAPSTLPMPSPLSRHRLPRSAPRRGATLVEVMIVMTVLVVAASIFAQMIIATSALRGVNRENAIAAEAARITFEEMRNEPFSLVYHLYNPDPNDDPDGPGTAPGHLREVPELRLLDDSETGFQLEILMPAFPPCTPSQLDGTRWEYEDGDMEVEEEAPAGGGGSGGIGLPGGLGGSGGAQEEEEEESEEDEFWELREDFTSEDLGLPRDLNGDSIIDAEDHSGDYLLLPITIRVEWAGPHGPRSYEVHSMLTRFVKE